MCLRKEELRAGRYGNPVVREFYVSLAEEARKLRPTVDDKARTSSLENSNIKPPSSIPFHPSGNRPMMSTRKNIKIRFIYVIRLLKNVEQVASLNTA